MWTSQLVYLHWISSSIVLDLPPKLVRYNWIGRSARLLMEYVLWICFKSLWISRSVIKSSKLRSIATRREEACSEFIDLNFFFFSQESFSLLLVRLSLAELTPSFPSSVSFSSCSFLFSAFFLSFFSFLLIFLCSTKNWRFWSLFLCRFDIVDWSMSFDSCISPSMFETWLYLGSESSMSLVINITVKLLLLRLAA